MTWPNVSTKIYITNMREYTRLIYIYVRPNGNIPKKGRRDDELQEEEEEENREERDYYVCR